MSTIRLLPIIVIGIIIAIITLYSYFGLRYGFGGFAAKFNLLPTNNHSGKTSYPHAAFFSNLARYYERMETLQMQMDSAAKSRKGVIGNIAWFPSQIYYYARAASQKSTTTICEIGYGAGHTTILYLLINPKAHIYSFDIFPGHADDRVYTPGETVAFQRAFQSLTLKAIETDMQLASRFHKVIGNSNSTVPKFVNENQSVKCDLLSIDGSHYPPQLFFDILHSKSLAHKNTIVLLDDMQGVPLRAEMDKAIQLGLLSESECLRPEYRADLNFASAEVYEKVFCAARYQKFGEAIEK